ncbi:MAG: hypothetical protein C0483_02845 [Pirellula sp.]|nr:hypothetical protein [Pirellula sp.]
MAASFRIIAILGIAVMCITSAGVSLRAADILPFQDVACPGVYKQHLQGACRDDAGRLYWCFTSQLVKTDSAGKIEREVPVDDHHGDLCYHDGKIFVAVNLGKFNRPAGEAVSLVYIYDADDLQLLAKHPVEELVHGAGGMAQRDGRFYLVGGLPPGAAENYVYEYEFRDTFRFVRRHTLGGGYTLMGIQTANFADDRWWFGCYGDPKTLLTAAADFSDVRRFEQDASLGLVPLGAGKFLVARGTSKKGVGYTARLIPAIGSIEQGLTLKP